MAKHRPSLKILKVCDEIYNVSGDEREYAARTIVQLRELVKDAFDHVNGNTLEGSKWCAEAKRALAKAKGEDTP